LGIVSPAYKSRRCNEFDLSQIDSMKPIYVRLSDESCRSTLKSPSMRANLTKKALAKSAANVTPDFLADMSHEIRTPLGAIIGLGHVLLSTNLDDKQRQCVTVLQTTAAALLDIVNRTLDISKTKAGVTNLETAPFNMAVLLDQIFSIMSVKAREKNIGLVLHYGFGASRRFFGDSGRVGQIIINLVGNAIKFTEAGKVTVCFAEHGIENGKEKISISVTDTGIGIPKNKIDAIFKRFVQVDSTIVNKFGGTGLGLAISKALAESMGGAILVTSAAGKGSAFVLHLQLPVDATVDEKHHQENIIYLDGNTHCEKLPLAPQLQYAESCDIL